MNVFLVALNGRASRTADAIVVYSRVHVKVVLVGEGLIAGRAAVDGLAVDRF